jgi:hypothetical protein
MTPAAPFAAHAINLVLAALTDEARQHAAQFPSAPGVVQRPVGRRRATHVPGRIRPGWTISAGLPACYKAHDTISLQNRNKAILGTVNGNVSVKRRMRREGTDHPCPLASGAAWQRIGLRQATRSTVFRSVGLQSRRLRTLRPPVGKACDPALGPYHRRPKAFFVCFVSFRFLPVEMRWQAQRTAPKVGCPASITGAVFTTASTRRHQSVFSLTENTLTHISRAISSA